MVYLLWTCLYVALYCISSATHVCVNYGQHAIITNNPSLLYKEIHSFYNIAHIHVCQYLKNINTCRIHHTPINTDRPSPGTDIYFSQAIPCTILAFVASRYIKYEYINFIGPYCVYGREVITKMSIHDILWTHLVCPIWNIATFDVVRYQSHTYKM